MIHIRRVASPDCLKESIKDLLNKLDAEIFEEDDEYKKEGSFWWVAEVNGEVAGFCGLKILKDSVNKGLVYLCRAGVKRKFRGKGLQKRMIKVRLGAARKIPGVKVAITYTSYENLASANSLISCGFKLYEPASKWGFRNGLYFRKEL